MQGHARNLRLSRFVWQRDFGPLDETWHTGQCPTWNGVVTSSSRFQSLPHGDEDIATPKSFLRFCRPLRYRDRNRDRDRTRL
jgi:hypothetical protein